MRVGQTSFIAFASKVVSSAAGFVSTIYFARVLGSSTLGRYYLVLSIVGWLSIFGSMGIVNAIIKRLSEGEDSGEFKTAGAVLIAALGLAIVVGLVAFRGLIAQYFGLERVEFVIVLLLVGLAGSYVDGVLKGSHLVHVFSLLRPVRRITRTVVQVSAVLVGFGLSGLVFGYAFGGVLVVGIGLVVVGTSYSVPSKRHVRDLLSYAKFAWLGKLEGKTFHQTDILLLGLFVSSGVVGVYGVTWNIAAFLVLFSSAISTALFPEISKLSYEDDDDSVTSLVEDSIGYAGLFTIPGLVGGVLLADRILAIYGEEFTSGARLLGILILAVLFYGYQSQFVNILGAIDHPEDAFKTNWVLILLNVTSNAVLIYLYGAIGAAVATASATGLSTGTGYWLTRRHVTFSLPVDMMGKQVLASLGMAGVVLAGEWLLTSVTDWNTLITVVLVGLGGLSYFALLLALSRDFRVTIRNNLPDHALVARFS